MRWKDFLHFQRGSKIAVILLLVLIVLTLLLNAVLSYRNSSEIIVRQNDSLIRAFEDFRTTLQERKLSPAVRDQREEKGIYSGDDLPEESVGRRGTAGKTDLRDEGARNGREAGTRYTPFPVNEKLTAGETISLNESDTTLWKMIPGIGSSYASRIVKYRELLGGYVRKEQLMEVYGMDNERYSRISPYIEPDDHCRKLQVNRDEFRELLRHPYLNYKQVKVIASLRRRKGDILSINELAMLDEFTSDDIWRLEPYLAF
ncbi:MAG: helix-hairpin-helix domain-containing protein [Bacteroidales bacterium]|jgi:DNA uptake protein ComE-like DNA-binding protein|nr:helix-hairpin-helix domain-containing protein [Bacteroidales bacterium]